MKTREKQKLAALFAELEHEKYPDDLRQQMRKILEEVAREKEETRKMKAVTKDI
jgi:hypothetical protein